MREEQKMKRFLDVVVQCLVKVKGIVDLEGSTRVRTLAGWSNRDKVWNQDVAIECFAPVITGFATNVKHCTSETRIGLDCFCVESSYTGKFLRITQQNSSDTTHTHTIKQQQLTRTLSCSNKGIITSTNHVDVWINRHCGVGRNA